jgi:hypothetical protein
MCHRTLRHQSLRPLLVAGRASLSRNHHGHHGHNLWPRTVKVWHAATTDRVDAPPVWLAKWVQLVALQSVRVYAQVCAGLMTENSRADAA